MTTAAPNVPLAAMGAPPGVDSLACASRKNQRVGFEWPVNRSLNVPFRWATASRTLRDPLTGCLAWSTDPRASRERVGLYSEFRSNYASGAGLKEARRTRAFVESHGVAAVVVEDGLRAFHGDGARLVGVAPARGGISVAVVQRFVGEEEGVLHPCLIDVAMSGECERDT